MFEIPKIANRMTSCVAAAVVVGAIHSSWAGVQVAIEPVGQPPADAIENNHIFVSPTHRLICWMQPTGSCMVSGDVIIANEKEGGSVAMITNGHAGNAYGLMVPPVFSPDGHHMAYGASKGGSFIVVSDGKEFDLGIDGMVGPMVYSEDSRVLAMVGTTPDKNFHVILGGKIGTGYSKIEQLRVSPHGGRFACAATRDGKQFVVLDGVEQPAYDQLIIGQGFSQDEKHFAYCGRGADGWHVVIDGHPSPAFLAVAPEGLMFSADGQHGAFIQLDKKEGERAILDGVPQPWAITVEAPTFSPTGAHFSYLASEPDGEAYYYVDGVKQAGGDKAGSMVFSKDGSAFAYQIEKDKQYEVIWNNQHLGPYQAIHQIRLSDDGKHIAYSIERDGKSIVYHDDTAGPPHDKTLDLRLSPDGRSVAYIGVQGNDAFFVVGNASSDGGKYIVPGTAIEFLDNNHVSCVTFNEGKVNHLISVIP